MSERFVIETGDFRTQIVAKSMEAAVVAAFKRRAPKEPSLLTRCKIVGRGPRNGPWLYIATDVMLRRAGYKVTL
jgi:hypothetical protein